MINFIKKILMMMCMIMLFFHGCSGTSLFSIVRPEQFFCTPEEPAQLLWTMAGPEKHGIFNYSISDCYGTVVTSAAVISADNGTISLPISLPQGFFEITFHKTNQRFGIVVLPNSGSIPDQFFCIDGALSTFPMTAMRRHSLLSMLKRMGIVCVKDRLDWQVMHPAETQWNWEANNFSEELRQLYSQYTMKTVDLFHNTPSWMRAPKNPYPANLVLAENSLKGIVGRWGKYWGGLEVWTEPEWEPNGGNLPADQYCSLVKTVAYACNDAKTNIPLAGGGFAGFCPEPFVHACASNGLLDHLDAFTCHPYTDPEKFEAYIQKTRVFLKQYGRESMPIWATESILPWPDTSLRPPLDAAIMSSALDMIIKVVESRACGIEKYFPFLYPPYTESGKNYGILDKNHTPLLTCAAYAQAVRILSNRSYIGDLNVSDKKIRRARIFATGNQCIVVVYTGELSPGASLSLTIPHQRIEGIDGRRLRPFRSNSIPVPDGIVYIWAERTSIEPLVRKDTLAMELYTLSKTEQKHRHDPSPIVLQHVFDPARISYTLESYMAEGNIAHAFPIRIRVNNMSETLQEAALRIAPDDRGIQIKGNTTLALRIPPGSFQETAWICNLTTGKTDQNKKRFTVSATSERAKWISPLAIDVVTKGK